MKTYIQSVLIFFFCGIIGVNAQEQTAKVSVKKTYKKVSKSYNKAKLLQLQERLKQKETEERNRAIAFAEKNNIPLRKKIEGRDGEIELVGIDNAGNLIYNSSYNVDAGVSTRTNYVNTGGLLGLNLNGDDMLVHLWEGGAVEINHQEFDGSGGTNRVFLGDNAVLNSNTYHATHVAGIMASAGLNPDSKGMAWQANVKAFDWGFDRTDAALEAANGMILSNHSYGAFTDIMPDELFGKYTTRSQEWDEIMYNAPYYLLVAAAGNDGNQSYNGAPLDGVLNRDKLPGRHQTAKNSLVVANGRDATIDGNGNLVSVDINTSSSQGPTDDYRIKPDITGNGTLLLSSYADPDFYPGQTNLYANLSGTSMASPNVCGSLLLLQEHYDNIHNDFMKAATLKGLALHTADDAGPNGPDPVYGWGLLNMKRAAEEVTKAAANSNAIIRELSLANGESYSLPIQAINGANLKVSISWTDPEGILNTGTNNTTPVLVNDLDLRLDKNGATITPWKLTGVNSNGTGDNIVDPFERIDIDNSSGVYVVTVSHKGLLRDGIQNFSLIITGANSIENGFVTTWKTDNPGTSSNSQILIPTQGSGYNYNVKWGDGSFTNNVTGPIFHNYANPGTYTVVVSGNFPRIYFNNSGDKEKILDIKNWGTINWSSMGKAFFGCSNLKVTASDSPDLSGVTNASSMFRDASSLSGSFSKWNVSTITDMQAMFRDTGNFDDNLGNWDVSNVTNMTNMLEGITFSLFNYDSLLNGWNTLGTIQNGVDFNGGNSVYCAGAGSRAHMSTVNGWNIADGGGICDEGDFVTTWITDNERSSNDNQITIPVNPGSTYNYNVSWGDGTTSTNVTGEITHTYATAGTYRVAISGTFPRIFFNGQTNDRHKLISVDNWGDIQWEAMTGAFYGCRNLSINALDTPDLSDVTSMYRMFAATDNVTSGLSNWDMSNVTNTTEMFRSATGFNENIGNWDVSNVFQMDGMFYDAHAFNQNISAWNTGKVKFTRSMFKNASNFNGDLSGWDTSKVEQMSNMFEEATSFNQNIGMWDVSAVKEMDYMFYNTNQFNQNIGAWNVSNVTQMEYMFTLASSFNQNLSNWDVSKVTDMSFMFNGTSNFDQSLGDWDISSVTTMTNMFFNVTLSPSNYDDTLIGWNTLSANETLVPPGIIFRGGDSMYCISETQRQNLISNFGWTIIDGGSLGCDETAFITYWKTDNPGASGDKQIRIPTHSSPSYNYNVDWGDGSFDTGVTGNITHTYANSGRYAVQITGNFPRIHFNDSGDKNKILSIVNWGAISWSSMREAFYGCSNLKVGTQDTPDLSSVTNMNLMFANTDNFDEGVKDWDVSNITSMAGTFSGAAAFNENLTTWNVSNVTNMSALFKDASNFNSDISNWEVGNVTKMNLMFSETDFNQDISGWNMQNVSDMKSMFSGADLFNQDISNWNTSAATTMEAMFLNAAVFDQNLGNWDISQVIEMNYMLNDSGLSISNYDSTLIGWGQQTTQTNVTLRAVGLTYCLGEDGRNNLISNGWQILGDQRICPFITTWKTDNEGTSNNNSILIPTTEGGYNYTVNWGDGTTDTGITGNATHTYASPGIYTVTIEGDFPRMFYDNAGDKNKLLSIEQWGSVSWSSMHSAFEGCSNLVVNATDAPDLSNVTQLNQMFYNCSNLNSNLDHWDVSTITHMNAMFRNSALFNGTIANWNVSNVENFSLMFQNAEMFNNDISGWSINSATNLNQMFRGASNFNRPISNWNVIGVTTLNEMFLDATAFNQDLSGWNITTVTDMTNALDNTGLSLTNYDNTLITWAGQNAQPNVTLGALGLEFCASQNARQSLASNGWMFVGDALAGSCAFVTTWKTDNPGPADDNTIVIPTAGNGYNYTVDWGDGQIEAGFTGDASHTYATPGTYTVRINGDFPRIQFKNTGNKNKIISIDQWGSIQWTNMNSAFEGCANLTYAATDVPDLSAVSDFAEAFRQCTVFNGDISGWDMSNAINMRSMFFLAANFNQNISGWNVSNVTDMSQMFLGAEVFDYTLGNWNISNVTVMNLMLTSSGLSTENYDTTLIGWASQAVQPNVNLGAQELHYCLAESARQDLIGGSWSITDEGLDCGGIAVTPRIFLQGALINPNAGEETLMRDDIRISGGIPTTTPFSDSAIIDASVLNTGGTSSTGLMEDDIVDWVWVELRDGNDHTIVVASQSALLQRDGDVVALDGVTDLVFSETANTYYVAVHHRNHMAVVSAISVSLTNTTTLIDFSANNTTALGGNLSVLAMSNGIFALYGGDNDGNGQIQNTDLNIIIQLLGTSGYAAEDLDMNGQIQNSDITGVLYPNIGRGQQF